MFPLTDREIAELAPLDLRSRRTVRYRGEGVSVPLAAFRPADGRTISRLYATLVALYEALGTLPNDRTDLTHTVARNPALEGWNELLAALRALEPPLGENATAVGQAIHDLRGGAFQALSMHLQLLRSDILAPDEITRVFLLTRDHLKIMRNCVPDLDPERYERDMAERAHSIRLVVEKWTDARYPLPGIDALVSMDCRYDGAISDRCVEFAALDRVLYNLINNATRYAADSRVWVAIVPLSEDQAPSLRFVVANRIMPKQRETLERRFGAAFGALFQGGFTTGGNGIGLRNCAELVCNAYGLPDAETAEAGRYLGAALHDEHFVAWFHWPAVAD